MADAINGAAPVGPPAGAGAVAQAYYFELALTGEPLADAVLRAVADAGHAAHHTRDWSDDLTSPIERAARAVADALAATPAPSVPAAPVDGVREMARRLPDSFIAEMRERRDLSRAICELVTLRNAILTAPVPAAPVDARADETDPGRLAARADEDRALMFKALNERDRAEARAERAEAALRGMLDAFCDEAASVEQARARVEARAALAPSAGGAAEVDRG